MSLNEKYLKWPFRSFLSFPLLSYIEIYIEYRQTALGGHSGHLGNTYGGPQIIIFL